MNHISKNNLQHESINYLEVATFIDIHLLKFNLELNLLYNIGLDLIVESKKINFLSNLNNM